MKRAFISPLITTRRAPSGLTGGRVQAVAVGELEDHLFWRLGRGLVEPVKHSERWPRSSSSFGASRGISEMCASKGGRRNEAPHPSADDRGGTPGTTYGLPPGNWPSPLAGRPFRHAPRIPLAGLRFRQPTWMKNFASSKPRPSRGKSTSVRATPSHISRVSRRPPAFADRARHGTQGILGAISSRALSATRRRPAKSKRPTAAAISWPIRNQTKSQSETEPEAAAAPDRLRSIRARPRKPSQSREPRPTRHPPPQPRAAPAIPILFPAASSRIAMATRSSCPITDSRRRWRPFHRPR